MIAAIRRAWANFRGFDTTGSTVPPMDGPLRPNARLDGLPIALNLEGVDNLVSAGGRIVCSVGDELATLSAAEGGSLAVASREKAGGTVTAIAAFGALVAVATEEQGLRLDGEGGSRPVEAKGLNAACITALAFSDADTLFVAVGSDRHPARAWKRDLMTKAAAGSVWRVDLKSGKAVSIATGLAFPSGVVASGNRLFVSEAWRHRVIVMRTDGAERQTVLDRLPAYPGRIVPASGGGFWLAMFAPRNPLVEFVLKEDDYRERMIGTIEPDYWIAPSLATGRSFLEPIQGGARKKLNMLKPWSPTWSTGLVVRCDERMNMLRSYHSRADGAVHGVTSMCEADGRLLIGAKGTGRIVAFDEAAETP